MVLLELIFSRFSILQIQIRNASDHRIYTTKRLPLQCSQQPKESNTRLEHADVIPNPLFLVLRNAFGDPGYVSDLLYIESAIHSRLPQVKLLTCSRSFTQA